MKLAPYPEYKDSGVPWLGKIPAHWDVKPGFAFLSERKEKNTGMKESTVLSLSYGQIVVKPPEKLHGLVPESFETYQIAVPGNIIIRGTDLQNDKTSLRVGKVRNRGIITSAYLCLQANEKINPDYAHLLLHGYDLMKIYYGMGSGLRQNLDFSDFKRLPVLVPSSTEQSKIHQYVESIHAQINKFIRNKRRLIELLKEQKQNVINQAVTRGLDPNVKLKPSGVEWIGDIPGHWEMRKITHLYRQIGSGTTPQSGNADYYDGNIPWIISGDLTDGFLETTSKKVTDKAVQDYSTLKMYPEGSLVVAMYGATIGKVSLTSIRACTNQACCVLSNPRNDINNKFMLQLFLKIKPDLVRMGYGGGQPNISQDTIKGLRLPIPSIEEQGDIVTFIENETATIDYAITHAKREIELMREYRTRLISDVVTGQVDVRGIEVPDVAEDELLALVEDTGEADEVIDDEGEMDETD
ncbi:MULTISPECIES: restriction endonuclease subunit S [Desulfovibrionaceae]|jgi:type I restriction enzyme S subunit|uniref:restriction endonuclease subunit S n=1 Tax=Paucidesulfovibrio longus TaxID=889 RepID=UPI0003B5D653|nr:restriction endonuclease subunit S [Paucidesulfovibrio longus]